MTLMVRHQLREFVTAVYGSRMSTGDEKPTGRSVAGGFSVGDTVENVVLMLYRIITKQSTRN